ncbi:MAG: efflux RND transporter permease subunit [Polyangiaceae bacterium]
MTSSSNSQGAASVALTFEAGIDPDIAQMQVQNKLQQVIIALTAGSAEPGRDGQQNQQRHPADGVVCVSTMAAMYARWI